MARQAEWLCALWWWHALCIQGPQQDGAPNESEELATALARLLRGAAA